MREMKARTTVFRVAIATTCVLGLVLAAMMMRGYNPLGSSASAASRFGVAESVKTSFGFVAVEHAEAISGLTDGDLAGAHGAAGLVQAGTIDVQIGATITNQTADVLNYTADQFELLDGNGDVVPLERAPLLPNQLQPNAAIDIALDFVTTTEARPFTVRFVDPITKQALLIDLGTVGCVVRSGTGKPLPVDGGCSKIPTAAHNHTGTSDPTNDSSHDTTSDTSAVYP
jgi:hypothetical protein